MACPCNTSFFSIPIRYGQDVEDGMNAFLRSVRLVHVHREIVCQDSRHYWAVSVEYLTGMAGEPRRSEAAKRKIDYKEELIPENFAVFARLREWRKAAAAREAVQLYMDCRAKVRAGLFTTQQSPLPPCAARRR